MYFLILFIIGIIPSISVAYKFFNRKEISFIDIYIIGCTLYYLLIPYYTNYLTSVTILNFDECKLSLTLVVVYLYLLLIVNNFIGKNSIFCMTRMIQRLDNKVTVPYKLVYICLFVSIIILYKVTNYSALDAENPEANNQLYFGSDLPLWLRCIGLFALQYRTILYILTFKLLNGNLTRTKRFIVYFTLCITTLSFLLGPKTEMATTFIFCGLYFYSIYRNKIKRKMIYWGFALTAGLFLIVFPLSQGLRMVKQNAVSISQVSFSDVVELYFTMSDEDKEMLKQRAEKSVQGRSTNVFNLFHLTCTHPFQGNGVLTYGIFKSLLPLKTDDLNINGNILGDTYFFKGADVGESVLSWFNADFRYIGLLLSIVFMFIFYSSYYYYYRIFSRIFKSPLFYWMFIYLSFNLSFSIERNPSIFFHTFYVDYLLGAILFGFIFKYLIYDKINIKNRLVG